MISANSKCKDRTDESRSNSKLKLEDTFHSTLPVDLSGKGYSYHCDPKMEQLHFDPSQTRQLRDIESGTRHCEEKESQIRANHIEHRGDVCLIDTHRQRQRIDTDAKDEDCLDTSRAT